MTIMDKWTVLIAYYLQT